MQKEFDLLNEEINLDKKYYTLNKQNVEENNQTKTINDDLTRTSFIQDVDLQDFNQNDQSSTMHSLNINQSDNNNNSINDENDSKKNI